MNGLLIIIISITILLTMSFIIRRVQWFNKHLNWAWILFSLLTYGVAGSLVIYTVQQPPPTTMMASPGHYAGSKSIQTYTFDSKGNQVKGDTVVIPDKWIEGSVTYVVDKEALETRNLAVRLFWFWPIYLIGTIWVSTWVLKHKKQSLWWLFLMGYFSPLWLRNKS